MKLICKNDGVALVTSLMFTLLALTISMVMLYMVLQSTQLSGSHKRYKNSLDAAVGGVDIVTLEALPYLISFAANPTGDSLLTRLNASMSLSATTPAANDNCLTAKLTSKTWGAACSAESSSLDAKKSPDMIFTLQSQIPGLNVPAGFRVYTKIVSTTVGATDLSGREVEAQATTGAPSIDIGSPYMYRIEVSGEKISNPSEKANLTVLYAY